MAYNLNKNNVPSQIHFGDYEGEKVPSLSKKIISLGINKYEISPRGGQISPRRSKGPESPRDAGPQFSRQQEIRDQIERDMHSHIQVTRKPFVRKPTDAVGAFEGLKIGNQDNKESIHEKKKLLAFNYQQQLQDDLIKKQEYIESPPRSNRSKPVVNQEINAYRETQGNLMSNIGGAESPFQKQLKKKEALEIQARNKAEILAKIAATPIDDSDIYIKRSSTREKLADQIDTDKGFFIGDVENNAAKKKEMQAKYIELLNADTNGSMNGGFTTHGTLKKKSEDFGYIQKSNEDFNIGGKKADKYSEETRKLIRQQEYRDALDYQKEEAQYIAERNALNDPSPLATMPYMKY
jgi:hypothetical protein